MNASVIIQKGKMEQTVATVCKSGQSLSSCIVAMNGIDETLYHHDGSLTNGISDNSYRYAGASDSVNNYVCFGSEKTTCPEDNLYRIIGEFDGKIKLIKAINATSTLLGTNGDYNSDNLYYFWSNINSCSNSSAYVENKSVVRLSNKNNIAAPSTDETEACNVWYYSPLNKINLNTNFVNNIGTNWATKIDLFSWKDSHNYVDVIRGALPAVAYQSEITNSKVSYDGNIGLMYVTDYGFAASSESWGKTLSNYNDNSVTSVNWMYSGLDEWTITPAINYSHDIYAFFIKSDGSVSAQVVKSESGVLDLVVRPVFYLNSSVTYKSGTGESIDPIRLG